ncbi:hypothetical protein [Arthrobacter sp. B0490]|uniref:hypothetical protein n=1 Tax=Arthrobacter sp. B0490 TaxID=2058891 RepID=UPI000CE4D6FB|nr:hypothetical protein [Arthrobacter sp. B0490]
MPRTTTPAGLGLAALLAALGLAACSAPAPEPPESADTGRTTAPASGPASDDGASGPASADGTYSSAELAGILGTLTEAGGAPLQVIPADQIDRSMAQARQFLESVTITPEECRIFVSNSLAAPEGAGYSTAVSSVDGDAVQTIVSASSSADASDARTRTDAASAALGPCASFSLDAQGVAIEQTVQGVEAATDAETTFGTVTTQTSSDGAEQETMTVVGTRGGLAVTALRTARDTLPEGTQDELQLLVDRTFAAATKG